MTFAGGVTYTPSMQFTVGDRSVRLYVCDVCAATIVRDPEDGDALMDRHALWHERTDPDYRQKNE